MSNVMQFTDQNFKAEVLDNSKPVLVDFWASWCGPCLSIAPVINELADKYKGKVVIGKMDVNQNQIIPSQYQVTSIPYIALFHKGELKDSVVGAVPSANISNMIDKVLNSI